MFTVSAELAVPAMYTPEDGVSPVDTDNLEPVRFWLSSPDGIEDQQTTRHGEARFTGVPSPGGEPVHWKPEIAAALSPLGEEVEVHTYSVHVNEEAVRELAEQAAAELHRAWQAAPEQASRSSKREKVYDGQWVDRALAEAELLSCALTAEQLELVTDDQTDFLDELPVEMGPGQAIVLLAPDGEQAGVIIDILNTDYQDLPRSWQQDNYDAAEGAAFLIADSIARTGTYDLEVVAEAFHQQWLEVNPGAEDGDQGLPYEELSEQDQERDRTVARIALSFL